MELMKNANHRFSVDRLRIVTETSAMNRKCETMRSVNYDQVADEYNKRYKTAYKQDGIASELLSLVHLTKARKVLEVGCGTGHWMNILQD